jgi:hypothetical protein
MYKAQGKEPPKEMDDTVVYNRGILWAAVHVEAIRNALKATGGKQPTGEDVKKGFESIHDFSLGGTLALSFAIRSARPEWPPSSRLSRSSRCRANGALMPLNAFSRPGRGSASLVETRRSHQ